ncbi:hypothetical protein [Streptomyces spirodelae]|uniref:Uncharacterized protein n=1 Tax=Streptomyces spirodelae TaxID=2812904 RepID=A0ABS3WQG3_9ACTN|nr:hypothetical protein [Streptomyces spirodelae]MBO8185136.1 hypothetical protein [Streptomyces spirodelae]
MTVLLRFQPTPRAWAEADRTPVGEDHPPGYFRAFFAVGLDGPDSP